MNQYPVLQTLANRATPPGPDARGLQQQCPPISGGAPHGGGFRSCHPGVANFLMAEGSVRFLQQSIDAVNYIPQGGAPPKTILTVGTNPHWMQLGPIGVYQALSTRPGGEAATAP